VKANGLYTVAGNSNAGYLGDGGPPRSAELNGPAGLSVDPSGHVVIADNGNNVIREITSSHPSRPVVATARSHRHRAKSAL
jgi:hypothetical protein